MKLICSSLLGAVGKGHFVINIFKNKMSGVWGGLGGGGWAGLLEGEHGRCCDFRFVFVFEFGGLWIDGGREIFYFKLLPQLFHAANV